MAVITVLAWPVGAITGKLLPAFTISLATAFALGLAIGVVVAAIMQRVERRYGGTPIRGWRR